MIDPIQNTEQYSSSKMQLHYYADATVKIASGQMYEDDGKDPQALAKERYQLLDFKATQSGKHLNLQLSRTGDYPGEPTTRNIELIVHNWSTDAKEVLVDGKVLSSTHINQNTKTLTIPLAWNAKTMNISIR